ncbi:MAG: hypothetical protein GQ574_24950 [Crocinitomix sp.]|nr:hypothetical protein [Crocinitomix sp.]
MIKYISIVILLIVGCTDNVVDDQFNISTSALQNDTIDSKPIENDEFVQKISPLEKFDTAFIERDLTNEFYHAIYIEKNRNSTFHQRLSNFKFCEFDSQNYGYGIEHFTKTLNQSFEKQDLASIPRFWVPLYIYKESYYLYAPSDWGNTGRRMFNDSAYVYWSMDGPNPIPLRNFEKINSKEFRFSTASTSEEKETKETIIYIIDEENKIAIFETQNSSGKKFQKLYVPIESVANFDAIVNYCNNQKQHEYRFEYVSLEKLKTNANN